MATILKPIKVIGRVIGALSAAGWYVSPHGYNLYRVQPGDTLELLAQQYLSSVDADTGATMIYDLQSDAWKATRPSTDSVRVGDTLFMPQEAIDRAKALGFASGGGGMPPAADRGVGSIDDLGSGGAGTLAPGAIAPISAGGAPAAPRPATPSAPSAPSSPKVAPSALVSKMKSPALLALAGIASVLGIGAIGLAAHHHAKRSNPRRRRHHARRANPHTWHGCDADCV